MEKCAMQENMVRVFGHQESREGEVFLGFIDKKAKGKKENPFLWKSKRIGTRIIFLDTIFFPVFVRKDEIIKAGGILVGERYQPL